MVSILMYFFAFIRALVIILSDKKNRKIYVIFFGLSDVYDEIPIYNDVDVINVRKVLIMLHGFVCVVIGFYIVYMSF